MTTPLVNKLKRKRKANDDIKVKLEDIEEKEPTKKRHKNTQSVSIEGLGVLDVDSYPELLKRASLTTTVLPPLASSSQLSGLLTSSTVVKKERVPREVKSEFDTRVSLLNERVSITHLGALKTRPYELDVAKQLFEKMHPVAWQLADAQDSHTAKLSIRQQLQQRLVSLDLLESSFADVLLYESGRWPALEYDERTHRHHEGKTQRTYPACIEGMECVCMTMRFEALDGSKPPGFVCTQLMSLQEYKKLIESNIQPREARPCVLCARNQMGEWVPCLRSMRRSKTMFTSGAASLIGGDWTLHPDESFQLFREIKDAEGGYVGKYMLEPNPGAWEGFIDPICQLNYSCLFIAPEATGKRRNVDQSMLKYKPEIKENLEVGETIAHF